MLKILVLNTTTGERVKGYFLLCVIEEKYRENGAGVLAKAFQFYDSGVLWPPTSL